MRLLVLGGTRFVGRALVDEALRRDWDVTALNRGITGALPAGVTALRADRTDADQLSAALAGQSWDAVVDTWSGPARVVRDAARILSGRVAGYGYVSSTSVYVWGTHRDEGSPLVDGDADGAETDYPAMKRGAELAVLREFPDALVARPGLILGPYEDIGRLPWWLERIAHGGRIVAPGRPQRPLQYVDARDLAAWLLSGLASGLAGAVDVISPSGHATTEDLLDACIAATGSDARLVWVGEAELDAAGVQPWTQLPCWVPEHGDTAGFLESDTARAAETGLVCRPVTQTVADTWDWLQRDGAPPPDSDRGAPGLPPELERQLLR